MLNLLICDDEPQILQQISSKVRVCMQESCITEVCEAPKLLQLLEEKDYDILLLDIDMPVINGLEVARRLEMHQKKPLLVFVTSYDELVYDSLQFHPYGFVRKSYLETELPKVLADCERELSSRNQSFCFHTSEGDVKLLLTDILYLESEGNYICVYTREACYRFRDTMAAVQTTLEASGFVRVHRGFLVNQIAVEVLSTDEVKLVNGRKLPIGRNYADVAKKQMMRYMLR